MQGGVWGREGGRRLRRGGGVQDGEREEAVGGLAGEFAQDAGAIEVAAGAPEVAPGLDPGGRDEVVAGGRRLCLVVWGLVGWGLEVGRVKGGDAEGAVGAGLGVEGVEEGAGGLGGVADHEQPGVAGGEHALNGGEDVMRDGARFVHDDEDVGGVEALKALRVVGAEAEAVPALAEAQFGVQEVAAEVAGGAADEPLNGAPEHVADLAEGGGGGEHDGVPAGVEEPADADGGDQGLAGRVAGAHGDAGVIAQGAGDVLLAGPEIDAEDFTGEGHRVTAPAPRGGDGFWVDVLTWSGPFRRAGA